MKCPKCQKEHSGKVELCSSCQDETVLLANVTKLDDSKEINIVDERKSLDETVLLSQIHNIDETEELTSQKDATDVETPVESHSASSLKSIQMNEIIFDRYEITSIIGKGGMGTVYLAKDLRLTGKSWAIKEVVLEKNQLEEFANEARMLVELEHPNLPKIVDYFTLKETGQTYLVMDYIKGQTLENIFISKDYKMTESQVIKYSIQLCNLLDYLHSYKPTPIVYRDLKPSNVIIDEKDNVQLIDFGIARKYQEGKEGDTVNIGTKGFAAPEQFDSNMQTDHRTDLYSLGATMYYLLSGGRFYISTQKPLKELNPNVKNELYDIVQKLLQADANKRYQSAKELKQDLLTQKVTSKLTTEPMELVKSEDDVKEVINAKKQKQPKPPKKKKGKGLIVLFVLFAVLLGGLYGTYRYLSHQESETKLVEKFEKAIVDKDYETLVQLINSSDKRLKITEDSMKPFVDYFEQNPQNFSSMIRQLKKEHNYTNDRDEDVLKLIDGDKKYFIIPTFEFEIVPSYVTVQTNRVDAKIVLNGKEIAVADEEIFVKNVGPLVPGLYDIEAIWDAQYMTLRGQQSVELFSNEAGNQLVELDLTGETITITSNYLDAKLFVDGVNTGMTVDDAKNFGPVITDGSMKVHAEREFPWGTVKSKEVVIKDNSGILLTIDEFDDQFTSSVYEMGTVYSKRIMELIAANDLSTLEDTYKTNSHHTELMASIHAQKSTVTPVKVIFDKETFTYTDSVQANPEVSYSQKIIYDVKAEGESGSTEQHELIEQVTLIYKKDLKQWAMKSVMPTLNFNSTETEEFSLTN